MSVAAPAAAPAAARPQPHRAAAGARPRGGGQTIKVPLRLVVGPQYADAALSVYVKIAALSVRPEGCTARVETIARYLGMSKSAVERGLRQLRNPDPLDGITEVPTVRRTRSGGTGDSAHRVTRPLTKGELWVQIPVRAAEALTPRLLRLYALLAYATARRIPVTAAELGQMLRHHTGQRAGEHLGERQARRLVDELAETGWLTVRRREGQQGRHAYETSRGPLHAVPAAAAVLEDDRPQGETETAVTAVIHDGSGSDLGDGSLASKEDLSTDRPGEAKAVVGIRRRRGTGSTPRVPVDNPVQGTFGRASLVLRTDSQSSTSPTVADRGPYTGPGLQLSPRVWQVLEPVRHHLPEIRTFVLRKIAHAIGDQLNQGASEERLHARLERRYARTEPVRDIGRWILGAGLTRHGCGRPECESGTVWETGQDCELCAVNQQTARARAERDAELARREQQLLQERERAEERRVLEDQEQQPVLPPLLQAVPGRPLPPKATYRQRDRTPDDEIRTAIAEQGRAVALHIYGHLRVLPLLASLPDETTGSDRRTHAQ